MPVKKIITYISLLLLITAAGCGPKIAVSPGYNFRNIKRVGVLKFDSSQVQYFSAYDPGYTVADEFVLQLLSNGIRVIERSRIEEILKEHRLWKSGNIDPSTIKEMGKILGVDALVMGTVTRYIPDRKKRIYIEDDRGNLQEEIFLADAEVGISARMVDAVTGEVVWAGSYAYDSFYMGTAIRQTVSALLDSLKKVWLQPGKG